MSGVPLTRRVMEVLMLSGTWVHRSQLEPLTTCAPALEDALADLVIEGKASFTEGSGYRMAGTELQRRAARILARKRRRVPSLHRWMVSETRGDLLVMGVAQLAQLPAPGGPEEAVLLYELEVPQARVRGDGSVQQDMANQFAIADAFFSGACE